MNAAQGLVCIHCMEPVVVERMLTDRCTDPKAPTPLAFGLLYRCPRCGTTETDAYAIAWAAVRTA